jgi:hypothetical protein
MEGQVGVGVEEKADQLLLREFSLLTPAGEGVDERKWMVRCGWRVRVEYKVVRGGN